MKKISLIVSHFYPENTAATNRLVSLANSLSKNNELSVFTLTEKGTEQEQQKVSFNGYDVYYVNQKEYNSLNFLSKFVHELFYTAKLCLLSRKLKADIIITSSPFMLLIYNVLFLSKSRKKLLDIRDLTWTYLPERNFAQRSVKWIFTTLAKFTLPKYDLVTVTNTQEYNWVKRNTSAKSIHIIPNGIELEKFNILSRIEDSSSHQKSKKVISYIGNLGIGQDILALVKLIHTFDNLELQIIGSGSQLEEITSFISINKSRNIKIIGKVEWNNLPTYYSKSDYLFAQLSKNYQTAIPSKLYEYISTGLPVIFSGEGVAAEFLSSFENTYCVKSEAELRGVLEHINSSNADLRSLKNIAAIKNNFIREEQNKKFAALISI